MDDIRQRVREANKVLAIVAKHGRHFFQSVAYERTAKFGLDGCEQIWYVDETTGMLIYPFFPEVKWTGFTHGSTLREFVARLAKYIKTGERLEPHWFPVDQDAQRWAYGEDVMRQVLADVLAETDAVAPC